MRTINTIQVLNELAEACTIKILNELELFNDLWSFTIKYLYGQKNKEQQHIYTYIQIYKY